MPPQTSDVVMSAGLLQEGETRVGREDAGNPQDIGWYAASYTMCSCTVGAITREMYWTTLTDADGK